MYCKKCGFITKGKESKCPYCGTEYETSEKLNQKLFLFDWLEISPRQIINLVLINIFIIIAVVDLILSINLSLNYHLTPWAFAGIFAFLLIFNGIVSGASISSGISFLKTFLYVLFLGGIILISYQNQKLLNYPSYVFVLGFLYPIGVFVITLVRSIKTFAEKKYNMLSSVFCSCFTITLSSVLFAFALTNTFQLGDDMATRLVCILSFAFVLLVSFNSAVFSYIKIKSKFTAQG